MMRTSRLRELAVEDEARARYYALISRLFIAAPDADLIVQLRAAGAGAGSRAVGSACRDLARASASATAEALRQQYDDVFVGVGRSPVTLYASHYGAPQWPDRYLLALREELARWKLGRGPDVPEMEDHIAGLCDVMRWLIEAGEPLKQQRRFFTTFILPAVDPLCDAIAASSCTDFYKALASLMRAFAHVERDAFQFPDAG